MDQETEGNQRRPDRDGEGASPSPPGGGTGVEGFRGGSSQALRSRGHAFVLLRFTLIIATSYMVLSETGFSGLSTGLTALIVLAIASNVAIARLPARWLGSRPFTAGVLVADRAWITTALILTRHFGTEFFYLYFFVLFLAAIGESLALIALGSVVVCSAYLYGLSTSGASGVLTTASLIRIPFLFAVASFYGYLVDRVRREQNRAHSEAEAVRRLEEVRVGLELANRRLEEEVEERRRVEGRLQHANRELAKLSELKSAFVSTVSHELRTPLTSIKSSIDLVRREQTGALAEPQKRFLAMARRNVERLAVIIDDLLDLSKIEAGKLEYRFEPVPLAGLLDDLRATFVPQAEASSVTLDLALDRPTPTVLADPQRLAQVVTNLVSNALKLTPAGGRVEVGVRRHGGWAELAVSDTGPGISREHRRRIFEPFYQAEDCLTRTVRGTGLGLSIARERVRAHGGDLSVTSAEGLGSRFLVRLPADLARAHEAVAFESEIREHRKYPFFGLLVVGWSTAEAKLAPLARPRASSRCCSRSATTCARSCPATATCSPSSRPTAAWSWSSWPRRGRAPRSSGAGSNGAWPRPRSAATESWCRRPASWGPPSSRTTASRAGSSSQPACRRRPPRRRAGTPTETEKERLMSGVKILVVDDEDDVVETVKYRLMQEGYEVLTARDGVEALGAARANQPDLVVLDVMMPRENGYRVSRMLREDEAKGVYPAGLRIVLLTARNLGVASDRERIFLDFSQADRMLDKPFDLEELVAVIEDLVSGSDLAAAPEQQIAC